MSHLTLRPGARLAYHRWNSKAHDPCWNVCDVSSLAHEHLFTEVRLDEGVTLADVLGLLASSPLLVQVYRRWYAQEFAAEASKGVSPDFVAGYHPEGIEYLELYQVWSYDSAAKQYQSQNRWSFHGVGYELKAPEPSTGFGAGSRIHWGVSTADVRELLPLPLKVNTRVSVCEEDLDSHLYGLVLDTVEVALPTLGQLFDAILWELSFYGGPAQRKAHKAELDESAEALASDDATTDAQDLTLLPSTVDDWYFKGVEHCFLSWGQHGAAAIARALRCVENDVPAAQAVSRSFGGDVVLKPEFASVSARDLRRAMRQADDA